MNSRKTFLLKAGVAAFGAVLAAAAFSAYLRPGMLVEFANLVLCT